MESFDALISSASLRVFAHSLQALGKIGKELYVEVSHDALKLRTLNDAKSAFCALFFTPTFFESFTGPPATLKLKLVLKACQTVLRTLRRVKRLRLCVEQGGPAPFLVMQLQCEYGVTKTHRLAVQDCQIMQAVFQHSPATSSIVAHAQQLTGLVEHIHGTDEVSLAASAGEVRLSSFHSAPGGGGAGGEAGGAGSGSGGGLEGAPAVRTLTLKTAMNLAVDEFDSYSFNAEAPVELTFCLKELKAILAFCAAVEADAVALHFHGGGSPIMLSADSAVVPGYTIELVLATMASVALPESQQSSQASLKRARPAPAPARAPTPAPAPAPPSGDTQMEDAPWPSPSPSPSPPMGAQLGQTPLADEDMDYGVPAAGASSTSLSQDSDAVPDSDEEGGRKRRR